MKLVVIGAGTEGAARATAIVEVLARRGHDVSTEPSNVAGRDLVIGVGAPDDAAIQGIVRRAGRRRVPVALFATGSQWRGGTTPDWVITRDSSDRRALYEALSLPPFRVAVIAESFAELTESSIGALERAMAKMAAIGCHHPAMPGRLVRWMRPIVRRFASFEETTPPAQKIKLTQAEAAEAKEAKAAAKQLAREEKARVRTAAKKAQKAVKSKTG